MTDLDWKDDPRHRATTIATNNDHQTQIQKMQLVDKALGFEAEKLAGDLERHTNGMREYAILQAKKGLAFDLLGICIDTWTAPDWAAGSVGLVKIRERLAELRADLQHVESLRVPDTKQRNAAVKSIVKGLHS